jgi:hypothetical protein
MPIFETPGGTRRDINLPQTEWPELKKATDAYATLKRELRATRARKASLESDRVRAENTATRAVKDAIREGKGEKEAVEKHDKEIERIDREIAACDRRIRALEDALDEAESEIVLVVDDNREAWLEELAPTVEEALDAYREAVSAVAAARGTVSRLYALRGWLRGFPEDVVTFKIGTGVLPKLRNFNGAAYYVSEVFAALVEDATPEPPAELEPFRPLPPGLMVVGEDANA